MQKTKSKFKRTTRVLYREKFLFLLALLSPINGMLAYLFTSSIKDHLNPILVVTVLLVGTTTMIYLAFEFGKRFTPYSNAHLRSVFKDPTGIMDERIGVQTIYLQYSRLQLAQLGEIVTSYNRIYEIVTEIGRDEVDLDSRNVFEYPEDVLEIEAIQTGNSITFKLKTGWRPSIDIKKGDFEVSIPKAYVNLLFVGYIVTNAISYGLDTYKGWIEIDKIELENEKLKFELNKLRDKTNRTSPDKQKELNMELQRLLDLTERSDYVSHIEINQGTSNNQPD